MTSIQHGLNALISLAIRLKELRTENGLLLEDVARIAGVQGKAVVSHWESAKNRRAPELPTLLLLAYWYGVSLDYLFGIPGAERDSPGVKVSKAALQRNFPDAVGRLEIATPSQRIALAYTILRGAAPDAWFDERMASLLSLDLQRWQGTLMGEPADDSAVRRFAAVVGAPIQWFYRETQKRK